MAARENQGYLIAVISLVFVALLLALIAFFGISKMNEYADNKAAAEQSLNLEKKLGQANAIRGDILKALIGDVGGSVAEVETSYGILQGLANSGDLDTNQKSQVQAVLDDVTAIREVYRKDMLANGSSTEGEQTAEQTWRQLIKNLSTVLGKKHNEYNVKSRQATLAEQEAAKQIAEKQAEVEQMQSTVATLEDDLRKEKQLAADKQKELTASLDQSLQQLQDANAKFDQLKLETTGKVDEMQNKIGGLEQQNVALKTKVNTYEREVFDRPDGQVVKVASNLGMVFLDLGRADGLTANRSFAIYDQGVTNFEKNKHKATIEVTRVAENQSEARVTEEDPNNPILPGDFVLTATWDPGYAVPIALAGKFDLDHDGFSDTQKLIQMIQRNGGKVVAWHDEDGKIEGKIDSSVRYLVLGESPSLGPEANPNVVRAMATLESQAEENTVQVINLQKLFNRMGVRGKPRVENIDRRSQQQFAPRDPSDTLKSSEQ